ncbi:MAG: M56 family metallopeptidase [Acidobacteria bacterium]|nr:M56 family metallopeptidase [Acidobacteriota bacterium]
MILRRDAASHLIARLATALWWWHPLTWVAVRQARLERERACDDLVLARGVLPSGYAADLVLFVESLRAPAAGSSSALAMARRSQLEGRVMTILESNVNRRGVSQAGILTAMLMLVWPLAAVVPAVTESATDDPAAVETSSQEQMPVRVGSQIKAPIKIVHVNPIYPEAAKAAGEQGIVIIEATIGIDGSVVDSSIIRPISEALNRAAVAAVSQWKFSPILLNGQAVPAIMTVTVNFRLDADGNPVPQPLPPDPPTQVDQQDPLIWSPGDQPLRIGGEIKAPQKIKDVAPVYPQDAKEARVSGIVILEIQLDADGRVTDAKVIRPVAMLSDAAVDAVLQWEFTPTLHNGQPVPVIMTVTVNFTLQ